MPKGTRISTHQQASNSLGCISGCPSIQLSPTLLVYRQHCPQVGLHTEAPTSPGHLTWDSDPIPLAIKQGPLRSPWDGWTCSPAHRARDTDSLPHFSSGWHQAADEGCTGAGMGRLSSHPPWAPPCPSPVPRKPSESWPQGYGGFITPVGLSESMTPLPFWRPGRAGSPRPGTLPGSFLVSLC